MNIADYYINGLPKIGTWRDMHMRIEGDAVNDLQEIFLTIWNKETKQNIGGEIYFPQHEDSTNIVVAIVDRTPKKNSRMLSHAYAMSIYSAQKNVHIVNPYFVPTSSIKKALNRTIDRGVNVTIMVSSASDIPFTPDAALYKLHKLMKRGATVYMYNGGFHHSKIMMIDRQPEQPQPPLRLRDERFHLRQEDNGGTEHHVPQRHRALHTVDTGILEKALAMEEVRRLVC